MGLSNSVDWVYSLASTKATVPSRNWCQAMTGSIANGKRNMRAFFAEAKPLAQKLDDGWWAECRSWADQFIGSFSADQQSSARFHLGQIVTERAWIAAQERVLMRSAYVIVTERDAETIRGRVETQDQHAKAFKARAQIKPNITPRIVGRAIEIDDLTGHPVPPPIDDLPF